MKITHFLCAFTLLYLIISCSQERKYSDNWPEQNTLLSLGENTFTVKKVDGDTFSFNLKTNSVEVSSLFLRSGKIYTRTDTIWTKLWFGNSYTPLFALNEQEGDTLMFKHPYHFMDSISGYSSDGVIEALIIKRKDMVIAENTIHVFDIYEKTLDTDYCRIIVNRKQGITGIWFVYDGFDEFEGFDILSNGMGWYPSDFLVSTKMK